MPENFVLHQVNSVVNFYAPQLYRQVLLSRVLAMGILSVRLSVRPSVSLVPPLEIVILPLLAHLA